MRRWRSISNNLPPLLFILGLIIIWELAVRAFSVPAFRLPSPGSILEALSYNWTLLMGHAQSTMHATLAGFALAIAVAIPLAVLMNKFRLFKRTFYPLLVISQTIPIIALAPVLMVWFGLGITSKIFVVVLVCFFPVAVNLVEGLENVDPELLELMKVMKAGPWLVFSSVQLPAVLPYLFSGLKIATTYSVMAAVIGEWLGAGSGLGIYMTRVMHSFDTAALFASIFLVVLFSLCLFLLVGLMEAVFTPWKKH